MTDGIIHLTLNTGDSRVSRRSEISEFVFQMLGPRVHQTSFEIPNLAPWRCNVRMPGGGALFDLVRGRDSAVLCGLAWDPADAPNIWAALEGLYFRMGDAGLIEGEYVPMPSQTPWLAVILMPGMAASTMSDIGWMGDFERCMAHVIMREVAEGRLD